MCFTDGRVWREGNVRMDRVSDYVEVLSVNRELANRLMRVVPKQVGYARALVNACLNYADTGSWRTAVEKVLSDGESGIELVAPENTHEINAIRKVVLALLGVKPGVDYHRDPNVPLIIAEALDEGRVKVRVWDNALVWSYTPEGRVSARSLLGHERMHWSGKGHHYLLDLDEFLRLFLGYL